MASEIDLSLATIADIVEELERRKRRFGLVLAGGEDGAAYAADSSEPTHAVFGDKKSAEDQLGLAAVFLYGVELCLNEQEPTIKTRREAREVLKISHHASKARHVIAWMGSTNFLADVLVDEKIFAAQVRGRWKIGGNGTTGYENRWHGYVTMPSELAGKLVKRAADATTFGKTFKCELETAAGSRFSVEALRQSPSGGERVIFEGIGAAPVT